ncbi:MAG: hypothetical protein AUJ92_00120 [Armatimonadetes bacterium CG2_30_59_28]|nr:MAG: hypothetical protein AUJ92_00120 [Armatimonadetes bacterium CG2_30_59_28]
MGRNGKKRTRPVNHLSIYRSVRGVWQIDPRTRVVPCRKGYRRPRAKKEAQRMCREEGAHQ